MGLEESTREELLREVLALRGRVRALEASRAEPPGQGGWLQDPGSILEPLRDHSLVLFVFEEASLRIVDANHAAVAFYGYPREEFLRKKVSDLNGLSESAIQKGLRRRWTQGRDFYVLRHRLANGQVRAVEVRCRPVATSRGVHYLSVVTDVTQRKKVAETLRASQDRYRALLRTAIQGIVECDARGVITMANPSYGRIHEMTTTEVLGLRIWDLMEPGPDKDRFPDYYQDLLERQPPPVPAFRRMVTKSGRVIDARIDWNYKRDRRGGVLGLVCLLTDVTERRRAAEALRRSEERFRVMVEQAPEAIVVYDAEEGRFADANANAERLFGCNRQELLAGGPLSFYRPDQPDGRPAEESMEEYMARSLAGEEVILERAIRTADGRNLIAEVRLARLLAGDRKLVRASYIDVTDQRNAERALRRAHDDLERRVAERTAELERAKRILELDIEARERTEAERDRLEKELRRSQTLEAVGRLAGGVAHEFNNLLGSVLGCLYVAGLEADIPDAVRNELDRARLLCKRGGELTRQLLKVARSETGSPEQIDVGAVLEEVRLLLSRTLPANIRLEVAYSPELPRVRGVRSSLITALLNLGINGRDAMPGEGMLTYAAKAKTHESGQDAVWIEVADTGAGIPEPVQERIFEPFFTTKPPGEGTGLGLSLVYATVKQFGGEIRVKSAPGRGTAFTLELPAESEGAGAAARTPSCADAAHPLIPGRVLLVEDEVDIGRMMVDVLDRHGYGTLRAFGGLEALELLRAHREAIGLVVLDLLLPGFAGGELYRLMRSLCPELPVLVVSGREDLAQTVACEGAFLAKPFTADEFLSGVSAALR